MIIWLPPTMILKVVLQRKRTARAKSTSDLPTKINVVASLQVRSSFLLLKFLDPPNHSTCDKIPVLVHRSKSRSTCPYIPYVFSQETSLHIFADPPSIHIYCVHIEEHDMRRWALLQLTQVICVSEIIRTSVSMGGQLIASNKPGNMYSTVHALKTHSQCISVHLLGVVVTSHIC